ncbi:MAG: efflux RND transporter periplasmic adaptor subunit [Candidatus Omnitrophota bacterium]|nr:efflux RND transporter periplasmic adaptor subunit [Candidatus Omnitrophota bacterium]
MKSNKYFILSIIAVLLLTAVFVITGCARPGSGEKAVYYCPMHPTYTSDRPGDCPICNMKLVKKEDQAAMAPMKSEEHKGHDMAVPEPAPAGEKALDEVCIEHSCTMNNCPMMVKATIKPGERILCPICGEYISTTSGKMVKIAESPGKPTGPTVMISPEKQQLIGVKTEPVEVRKLTKVIRASGKIAYDPELVVAQEEFIQALKNEENTKDSPLQDVVDRAKVLTEASRRKLILLGMSGEQIAGLEKTKKADTTLYLPSQGENVWAYISVYEYEIASVKTGDTVDIEAVAYPGTVFTGTVKSINPVLDPATRTNLVRVEVANPESKLKPEMFINASIKVDLKDKLAVPEAAVLDTGIRKIVYLSRENGVLESREVKLGPKAEGFYEVIEGLSAGDIVVTSGNFLIDSESRLKSVVPSSGSGGEGHKHGQ